jgi:two-component system sensor histidine kinase CpxA
VTSPAIVQRRDEIGELARDFNHMASRIERLMQAQRRLIANVSHELRSPLTRLSLALGLMRRRSDSGDPISLARMSREIERLNSLIGQLLTLSRLEYLDLPGPMETLDLSAIVHEIAADANFEATSIGVSVRVPECDACTIRGAPDLVRSAIENVVLNAVKYTDPHTAVSVHLVRATDGRTASVVVQDQGPGLPETELAHVFEPFYRADAARDRHTGGAGLGLAITHRVVTLHGGSVSATNLASRGLECRITFPLL